MKNALISPNEIRESGYRVAEVVDSVFEVAAPLFWVSCDDTVQADVYWYNQETNEFILVPIPEPDPIQEQPTSEGAQTL